MTRFNYLLFLSARGLVVSLFLGLLLRDLMHSSEYNACQNNDFFALKMLTSKIDKNEYEHIVYENGMQVILVSNPDFDKGACAVSVGVGSYDNPSDISGLAHFLEHMLFMGSKKYPNENYFMELVNKYGGYTNAYTSSERTCYYSGIHKDHLEQLVDALAGFFTSPLLKEDGVSRELNAVHSEYTNGMCNQDRIQWELMKVFVKDGASLKGFSCGNLSTLKRPEIHKEVVQFYNDWYSSEKCAAVICGVEPLEKLRELATVFKCVKKNHDTKHRHIDANTDVFKSEYLCKKIKSKSLSDKEDVRVHVIIPSMKEHFKINPLGFLEHVMCSDEKGSLLNKFKNNGIGYGVSLGHSSYNENTLVKITLKLTNLKHKAVALQMLYDELTILLPQKTTEVEYQRIAGLKRLELEYVNNASVIDTALGIAANTLSVPWNYSLHSNKVFEKFDEEVILGALTAISDCSKWLIVDFTKNFTREEQEALVKDTLHQNIEYYVGNDTIAFQKGSFTKPLPHEKDKALQTVSLVDDCRVSHTQEYQGRKIIKDKNLHFVFDSVFGSPKGRISVYFKHSNTENLNQLTISTRLLLDSYKEEHHRYLENNHVEISIGDVIGSVRIDFKGFNTTLSEVVMNFFAFSKINMNFAPAAISKLKTMYAKTVFGNPYLRSLGVFTKHVRGVAQDEKLLKQLDSIEPEILTTNTLLNLPFDVIAVGNLDFNEIKKMNDALLKKYSSPSTKNQNLKVVDDDTVSFVVHNTKNNILHRFYEVPKDNVHFYMVFSHIFSEKFFNELRTKEQLGYIVRLFNHYIDDRLFVTMRVQSEKDTDFLSARFDKFISEIPEKIQSMTEDEFSAFKEGVVLKLTEKVHSLEELFKQTNSVYTSYDFDFKKPLDLAEKINAMTKYDLKEAIQFNKLNKVNIKSIKE